MADRSAATHWPSCTLPRLPLILLCVLQCVLLHAPKVSAQASLVEQTLYNSKSGLIDQIMGAMQGSIRTSWEQGTAAGGVLEVEDKEYSVFASSPFQSSGTLPVSTLRFALSAVVRQTPDGRLSQDIGDGTDAAALDGASSGPYVLLGSFTESSRQSYWQSAAEAQLNYLLYTAPRTKSGAISHRSDVKQYWSDGVYMAFPFIATYGAVTSNQTLLQLAYDQCRLYRDALLVDGPTGMLWAHVYDDDTDTFTDKGTWATGNAWAALGMLRVMVIIMKSSSASAMTSQINDLTAWIKEILDGTLTAITSKDLLPDYISGGPTFEDASASAALASVAYRCVTIDPSLFGSNYTTAAATLRDAVLGGIDDLGVLTPVVDPLQMSVVGVLSTEAQAFGLMMMAAWRDYLGL